MKCSHCGFNFQGTTQTKKYANPDWEESKTRYYNDGGYHAKGLSVCTPLRIKKDLIETFVVHSIKEYIAQSNIGQTTLKKLEEMLEGDDLRISERDRVMVSLNENAKRMSNLINLVESGAKLDSVIQRIKELERERDLLQEHLHIIEKSVPSKADLKMMADEIARIVMNFQNEFYNSTLAQQKQLIRRFVAGVMVYREDKAKAQCYIRKIPLTNSSMGSSLPCVAGGRHTTYGKIDLFENRTKFDSSSKLLIQTIPTFVKIIDTHSLEFNNHSQGLKSSVFMEISLSKIALITEIALN
jgi:hypothetical protein